LPKPTSSGTQLPTTDTSVVFNSVAALNIDHAIERDCAEFVVAAGDTVLVTLGRNESTTDVYPEIGVLRVTGIVYSGT